MQISVEHAKHFLKSMGINWSGLYANNNDETYAFLKKSNVYQIDIDRKFITIDRFTGTNYQEGDRIKVINNPNVKYVQQTDTEFKLYNVLQNPNAGGFYTDQKFLKFELDIDLSKKWIQYLVRNIKRYAAEVLEECEYNKKRIPEVIKTRKSLMQRKIEELKKENDIQDNQDKKRLNRYLEIEAQIKELING